MSGVGWERLAGRGGLETISPVVGLKWWEGSVGAWQKLDLGNMVCDVTLVDQQG